MTGKRKLLYVMSPSYSGSTLLTRVLARHPEIATIGELKASALGDINKYLCSCGERLLDCQFWKSVKQVAKAHGEELQLDLWRTRIESDSPLVNRFMTPLVRGQLLETLRTIAFSLVPGAQTTLEDKLKHNQAVVEAVCEVQNGSVFLDESKDPLRLMYFEKSAHWDLRVIRLVRDGRGQVNSNRRHNGLSVGESALDWKKKIVEMDHVTKTIDPNKIINVRYEDFCSNTDEVLSLICQFASLSAELPSFSQEIEHHIIGNDMRLKPIGDIRLDEKWRTNMTEVDLAAFEAVAGSTNRGLGYGD